jgi:hypothetical protein
MRAGLDTVEFFSRTFTVSATPATLLSFYSLRPFLVQRVGVLVSTAVSTAPSTFNFNHQYQATNVTPSENSGTISIPTTGAVNRLFYRDASEFTLGKPMLILPGEALAVLMAGGGTAGVVSFMMHADLLPFQNVRFRRPAGALTTPNDATFSTTLSHATLVTA